MTDENPFKNQHYILRVCGKHGLVFKTHHNDRAYLEKVADELLQQRDQTFTKYEIHNTDHPNMEMTEPEHLLHIDASELPSID